MVYPFILEEELDSSDLVIGFPLKVTAEVEYDSYTDMRSVTIKAVSMEIEMLTGSTLNVPVALNKFTDGTLRIWQTRIEEKFDLALVAKEGA